MTSLQMPKAQKSTLLNKEKIINNIGKILKPENILTHKDEVRPYETDALTAYRQTPLVVVLPETVSEVSRILKYCNENNGYLIIQFGFVKILFILLLIGISTSLIIALYEKFV